MKPDILVAEQVEVVESTPFNVTDEYMKLQGDSKDYVKMILKTDETITKSFFVKKVLIVEGDTEQVVLTETLSRMPNALKSNILSGWHIVRARGKAAIIPLVRYLKSMSIDVYVMHNGDFGVEGAEKFNTPIQRALNNDAQLVVLHNCIEDVLGYLAPSADKPFAAYKYIQKTWTDWNSIPECWRRAVEKNFVDGNIIVQK